MPLFLPVKLGGTTVAVARCDRCRKKMYYDDLVNDDNSPGLKVCPDCSDEEDPYKKPQRPAEKIGLKHPRSDDQLV